METFIVQFCIEDKSCLNCTSFFASLKISWFSQTISSNHLHCITCSLTCSFPALWRGVHVLVLKSHWFIWKPSSYVLVQRYVSQEYGKHLGPEKLLAEIWFLINYRWKTENFFTRTRSMLAYSWLNKSEFRLLITPMITDLTHVDPTQTLRPMLRLEGMWIAACLCWNGVCPL